MASSIDLGKVVGAQSRTTLKEEGQFKYGEMEYNIYIGMIKYYGYCFIKFTSGTSSGWSCCINLMDKSGDKVLNIPSTINNLDIPDELDLVDYSNQTAYTLLTSKTYLLS